MHALCRIAYIYTYNLALAAIAVVSQMETNNGRRDGASHVQVLDDRGLDARVSQRRESQAKDAIQKLVRCEFRRLLADQADELLRLGDIAEMHSIQSSVSSDTRAIAVRQLPRLVAYFLVRG